MKQIKDYTIIEKIAESKNSIVYKGKRDSDNLPVVIKTINAEFPSLSAIARFKQEFELIKKLEIDGIVRAYDVTEYDSSFAIILEDFGGISLSEILKNKKIDIKQFLKIGIEIANTLGNLHKDNVIHRDIKPANILVNESTGQVKITDFGISKILTNEDEEIYNTDVIEGTLIYMSPEQTGRMNRAVDYRTDFYSLGITFYEMLTGEPPFKSKDPMELIHSHIAKQPLYPTSVNQAIPEVVSEIIMKLLLKTAEERYQNGFGLLADLKECLNYFETGGTIPSFEIAKKDISIKFIVPQKVYGRDAELEIMLSAFDRVSAGSNELLLVSGSPGIGKSAVINEVHKPIVAKRGYFISGKYDLFKKDVPYSAIIQALNSLMDKIITESEERIEIWKTDILSCIGNNGSILVSAIPKLELIIGKQQEIEESDETESRGMFDTALKNFFSVFAKNKYPLVIFLDDVQWADVASIAFIRKIVSHKDIKHLLLVLSYRDNEIDESHPFAAALTKIKKAGAKISSIVLTPLDTSSINYLIYNFLRAKEDETRPLAELIFEKTNGNPFFVNQFMKTIYESGLLKLDPEHGWKWNIDEINSMKVTDNVIDLMVNSINSLPPETQEILKICACIGNRFDLETISLVFNKSIDETLAELTKAIDKGLIAMMGDTYIFHHDRILEAAYTLLDDEEKIKMHYKIGNYLINNTKEQDLPDKILYIVNQMNRGSKLITDKEEKYKLVELNLMAAKKAKNSSAFETSFSFLKRSMDYMDVNHWLDKYDLSVKLYTEAMIMAYRANNTNEMDKISKDIFENAKNVLDKVRIYEILILSVSNLNKHPEAIKLGVEALNLLGLKIPEKLTKFRVYLQYLKIKHYLTDRKIKSIQTLPGITNKRVSSIMRIITMLHMPTQSINQPLYFYNELKRYELIMKYGLPYQPGVTFGSLSLVLSHAFSQIDVSFKLMDTAILISDKEKMSVEFMYNSMLRFFKFPLRSSHGPLMELHRGLLQSGDIQTAGLSLLFSLDDFYVGRELNDFDKECAAGFAILTKMKFLYGIVVYQVYRQHIQNLLGLSKNPARLEGDIFSAEKIIPVVKSMHLDNILLVTYIQEMVVAFTFGDFEFAAEKAEEAYKIKNAAFAAYLTKYFPFYYSIINLAIIHRTEPEKQKIIKHRIKKFQKLLKFLSQHGPVNFLHKYYLVEAEINRVNGNDSARDYYDKAIEEARNNEYIQEAALACELAANYYLEKGKENIAGTYMYEAVKYYNRWGAAGKIKQMQEKYPDLLKERRSRTFITDSDSSTTTSTTTTTGTASLDISTIVKTSQALSSEFDLDKLLEKIMNLSITNAGAQKGSLILEREGGGLYIEAAGKANEEIKVLQSIPVNKSEDLSPAIVNFVNKTKENLVINNATGDTRFANDPYIVKNKSKSILCSPIVHKGKMSGIIYLENNLATGAFTGERLELLNILSSQAAISIENSRLLGERENAAKLQTEMNIAANIQTSLLPRNPFIEGYEITGHMKPADEVGGDYYDVINVENTNWLVIGDVSGHGVPAGLVMMMVQTSIHSVVKNIENLTPSEVLVMVNKVIYENIRLLGENKYMTLTLILLDNDGVLHFSGLHQDITIYRAETKEIELVATEGMWIGIEENIENMILNDKTSLNHNDVLLLYTDGVTEAWEKGTNKDDPGSYRNLYGEAKLNEVFRILGEKSTSEIRDGILKSLEDYDCPDDVTMLILKRK